MATSNTISEDGFRPVLQQASSSEQQHTSLHLSLHSLRQLLQGADTVLRVWAGETDQRVGSQHQASSTDSAVSHPHSIQARSSARSSSPSHHAEQFNTKSPFTQQLPGVVHSLTSLSGDLSSAYCSNSPSDLVDLSCHRHMADLLR